jgi:cytoskeletal protein RodZ
MTLRHKMIAHVVWSGLLFWSSFGEVLPAFGQQTAESNAASNQEQTSSRTDSLQTTSGTSVLPDSPSTAVGQSVANQQSSGGQIVAESQAPDSPATPQRPVGTAAAEAPYVSGVAASQPAGVAIAPAKQRRMRTILIRTGAIVAACVAVGVVVALSEGTSSKPPGAH